MLQGRTPGGKWTSPARDITYLFPALARNTCEEFVHLRPIILQYLDAFGLTVDDITPVAGELAHFINDIHRSNNEDEKVSGFPLGAFLNFSDKVNPKAAAVFAYFFMRQAFFHYADGILKVTHPGENDAPDFSKELEGLDKLATKKISIWQKLKAIWKIIIL